MDNNPVNPFEASYTQTGLPTGQDYAAQYDLPSTQPSGIRVIGIVYVVFGALGLLGLIITIVNFLIMGFMFTANASTEETMRQSVAYSDSPETHQVNLVNVNRLAFQDELEPSATIEEGDDSLSDSGLGDPVDNAIDRNARMERQTQEFQASFRKLMIYQIPPLILSTIVSILMLVSGIGLLMSRLWGAKLGVIASYAGIFNYVVTFGITLLTYGDNPALGMMQDTQGVSAAQMQDMVQTFTIIGLVIGLVFYLLFGALYLWIASYLRKPHVRAFLH